MLENASVRTTIAVKDRERAKKFYTESLGLTISQDREDGVTLDAGDGTSLELYESQFAGTAKSTLAGFQVKDIDGTMSSLREKGVTFEEYDMPGLKTENGVAQLGPVRGAWFKDPDGNILAVVEQN
jgi:catechol 2,3-dioxygenase-like lactoylglutathione lyase family enzyme